MPGLIRRRVFSVHGGRDGHRVAARYRRGKHGHHVRGFGQDLSTPPDQFADRAGHASLGMGHGRVRLRLPGCCYKRVAGRLPGGSLVSTGPCRLKKRGPAGGVVERERAGMVEGDPVSAFVSSNSESSEAAHQIKAAAQI